MFFGSIGGRITRAMSKVKSILSMGGHARVLDIEEEEEPEKNEIFYDDVAIEIPDDIDEDSVTIADNLTDEQLAMVVTHSIQRPEEQMKKSEPYDDILDNSENAISANSAPEMPDGWDTAYFPAGGETGGKPNMARIREWVKNVKFTNMSTLDMQVEYGIKFNMKTPNKWDDKMKKTLVEAVAYLVARKIWYVGRKPSGMSDGEWDDLTRDKRPPQGSFSKNEHWGGAFPYTQEYSYSSWGDKEVDMLEKSGSFNW
tara:strand:+ start:648 stop:1415 length:768 start_codon:yes stop_codon:yes gene_type:complete